MRMKTTLLVASLCLMILLVPMARASAETESFSIYTDKEEYEMGESVNIYVKANAIDPNETITVTDVVVYDESNSTVAEWRGISIVLEDTTTTKYVGTFAVGAPGNYTIWANATGCLWILCAIWRFICRWWRHHVIPEYPLGTIGALVAFLAAAGIYIFRKKRYQVSHVPLP